MALTLSPMFADGCVLQRNRTLKVHGVAGAGDRVVIEFAGGRWFGAADDAGVFAVPVGPLEVTPGETLMVGAGGNGKRVGSARETVEAHNVAVGDVWLLGGQSNMELTLGATAHAHPEALAATDPLLRQLTIRQLPKWDSPRSPADLRADRWRAMSPTTASGFSAVGYFFGAALRERTGVPIGLVATAVSGTPIAAWLPRGELERLGVDLSDTDRCTQPGYVNRLAKNEAKASKEYTGALDSADSGFDSEDATGWATTRLTEPVTYSGSTWFRTTITVPKSEWGKPARLFLGLATDADYAYVDGELVGHTPYAYPQRDYALTLPSKPQITITLRLLTYAGVGGWVPGKSRFVATDARTFDLTDAAWERRTGAITGDAPPPTFVRECPAGMFNGMIAPLEGMGLSGICWYQGETDTSDPARYVEKLHAFVMSYRRLFGNADLPVLVQQLAYWDASAGTAPDLETQARWEQVRAAQRRILELPHTGLSSGYDVGEFNDLHPQDKRVVGERLARLAARVAYGDRPAPNMHEQYHCD